jgi:hypothetical protein
MGLLKRLLGGELPDNAEVTEVDSAEVEAEEREREREVLESEQAGFDELTERQLRYAKYAWQPPAQGGERRADEGEPRAEDKG